MFGKKKKTKSNYYFDSFPELAHFAVECGEYILDFMKNFDHSRLQEIKENAHEIEHRADETKHRVTEKLLKEFMTPIDREDIFELMKLIDDVTDAMEEISLKLYLYDYKELPANTILFTEVTVSCIKAMEECMKGFPDYLDYQNYFRPLIQNVIKLEEESDTIYIENMHTLYQTETDGFKRHRSEAMYTMLEEISDRCREVCRFAQTIVYKNI